MCTNIYHGQRQPKTHYWVKAMCILSLSNTVTATPDNLTLFDGWSFRFNNSYLYPFESTYQGILAKICIGPHPPQYNVSSSPNPPADDPHKLWNPTNTVIYEEGQHSLCLSIQPCNSIQAKQTWHHTLFYGEGLCRISCERQIVILEDITEYNSQQSHASDGLEKSQNLTTKSNPGHNSGHCAKLERRTHFPRLYVRNLIRVREKMTWHGEKQTTITPDFHNNPSLFILNPKLSQKYYSMCHCRTVKLWGTTVCVIVALLNYGDHWLIRRIISFVLYFFLKLSL